MISQEFRKAAKNYFENDACAISKYLSDAAWDYYCDFLGDYFYSHSIYSNLNTDEIVLLLLFIAEYARTESND